jgi:hypothetical protein
MKFEKHFPTDKLKDYIKYYVVSENEVENDYKVFPAAALFIGYILSFILPQMTQISEDKTYSIAFAKICLTAGENNSYLK